jgi:predicted RNA-binding Zn ribbon-like protein
MTGFIWFAGRPALDLCNTRFGAGDLLRTPADLARWLHEAGLPAEGRVGERDLHAVVALRDALRAALLRGDAQVIGELASGWLDRVHGHLSVDADTLRPRFCPSGGSAGCALTPAVLDALELARECPGRVRECAAEACRAVYLDTSRNRSRRWCSMQRCGGRAKATAYYRRHRAGGASAA